MNISLSPEPKAPLRVSAAAPADGATFNRGYTARDFCCDLALLRYPHSPRKRRAFAVAMIVCVYLFTLPALIILPFWRQARKRFADGWRIGRTRAAANPRR